MSYLNEEGRYVVHGDCPVSFLTEAEIGRVRNETFYLSVVMRNKGGKPITVRTFVPKSGFLHPAYSSSTSQTDADFVKKSEVNVDKMDIEKPEAKMN